MHTYYDNNANRVHEIAIGTIQTLVGLGLLAIYGIHPKPSSDQPFFSPSPNIPQLLPESLQTIVGVPLILTRFVTYPIAIIIGMLPGMMGARPFMGPLSDLLFLADVLGVIILCGIICKVIGNAFLLIKKAWESMTRPQIKA